MSDPPVDPADVLLARALAPLVGLHVDSLAMDLLVKAVRRFVRWYGRQAGPRKAILERGPGGRCVIADVEWPDLDNGG